MEDKELYVTRPDLPDLEEMIPYLQQIWSTRILTNDGPLLRQLEIELASLLNVSELVVCANGTLALMLALKAAGVTGEVVTTPFSFVATTHAIRWIGLEPVFADIDPDTMNLDPVSAERAISARTGAILPVHCFGAPCDTEALDAIAASAHVPLVYDAAHAFGIREAGNDLLGRGLASALSFHATKLFHTFEGGAIATADARIAERLRSMRNFGIRDEITVDEIGINAKLDEFGAAVGLAQLSRLSARQSRLASLAESYRKVLRDLEGVRMPPTHGQVSSYFPVRITPEFPASRDALYEFLHARGIRARRYFYPLISSLPMYRNLPSANPDRLPVANRVSQEILCLPIYPSMTEIDVERVSSLVHECARVSG